MGGPHESGNVPRTRSVGCSSRGAQNPHRPHTREPSAPAAARPAPPQIEATEISWSCRTIADKSRTSTSQTRPLPLGRRSKLSKPSRRFGATLSPPRSRQHLAAESFAAGAHPAANATAMTPTAIVAPPTRFISTPAITARSGLRFGERRRIELRIHRDFVDDDLVGLRVAVDDRLDDEGNLQALHRTKIALMDPYAVHLAIHPPRDALDLDVEEALRGDPDALQGPGPRRELELVGVAAGELLDAIDLELCPLRLVVDQWVIHLGVRSRTLQLLQRERFDVVAVEIRAHLPAIRAVVDLHRGLARELDLEARLVGALSRELERQLHLLLGLFLRAGGRNLASPLLGPCPNAHATGDRVAGSGIHLAAQRQRLHAPPRLQATPRQDVLVDDCRRAQAPGFRFALGREQR